MRARLWAATTATMGPRAVDHVRVGLKDRICSRSENEWPFRARVAVGFGHTAGQHDGQQFRSEVAQRKQAMAWIAYYYRAGVSVELVCSDISRICCSTASADSGIDISAGGASSS